MTQTRTTDYDRIRKHCTEWTTSVSWATKGFGVKLSSRISELLANGEPIESRWITLPSGKRVKEYRYVKTKTK